MGYALFPIVALAVFGLVPGALARLVVPGRNPMGCGATWLLGFGGLIVGGSLAVELGGLVVGHQLDNGALLVAGSVGSILGAVAILLVYRAFRHRTPGVEQRPER